MLREKELIQFRQGYYSLFVRLWWKEPAAELVDGLKENIADRSEAAAAVHPLMGDGWQAIRRFLSAHSAEAVAQEFTHLFLGPFVPKVNPYESYYLTGKFFGAPLVVLRSFLKRLGLEKREEEVPESEDMLAFELEVMRWLIGKQMAAASPEEEASWLRLQAEFLKEHLLVWVPACAQDVERAEGADFYRGAALALRGFLEVERALFRPWGLDKVASLDEARKRYGSALAWRGPTFDPAAGKGRGPMPTKEE